jgi:hypothetical protein
MVCFHSFSGRYIPYIAVGRTKANFYDIHLPKADVDRLITRDVDDNEVRHDQIFIHTTVASFKYTVDISILRLLNIEGSHCFFSCYEVFWEITNYCES